jgi:hypothetical protein
MVLCDAVMMGDRRATEKWGVPLRTLQSWRSKLETDATLRTLMQDYRKKQTEKWLEDIPIALSGIINFVKDATHELNPSKAEDLVAVVTALEAIADVKMTEQIIAERLKDAKG